MRIMVCILSIFLFLSSTFLNNTYCADAETKVSRLPNHNEAFFWSIATKFNAPQFCEKIDSNAYMVNPGLSIRIGNSISSPTMFETMGIKPREGYDIYYLRSLCYLETAIKHNNPDICGKVTEVKTPGDIYNGSMISPLGCLKTVKDGYDFFEVYGLSSGYPLSYKTIDSKVEENVMRAMNYPIEVLRKRAYYEDDSGLGPNATYEDKFMWYYSGYFSYLWDDADKTEIDDFLQRLQALPSSAFETGLDQAS